MYSGLSCRNRMAKPNISMGPTRSGLERSTAQRKGTCLSSTAASSVAWAAAVAEQESGWNPLACGDNGLSVGLWQMHPTFIAWMWPEFAGDGSMLRIAHCDPFFQADTFERFWNRRFAKFQPADKLRIYHYGEAKAASLATAENPDPDGYVAAVRAITCLLTEYCWV